MAHRRVDGEVWIGTSLGILKGLNLGQDVCLNYIPSNTDLKQMDRSREVLCMCWGEDKIYMGLKNSHVQCFDTERRYICSECDLSGGSGHFIGLARHDSTLVTCTNEGHLCYWPDAQKKNESSSVTVVDVGRDVCSMSTMDFSSGLFVSTGGKENDLKVWDSSRPDLPPIFKARNVPHDYLNLRVPIWVRATGFVPATSNLIAVATAYHQIRLYDTRTQRRPVYSHSWGDAPFTCLDVTQDGRYFIVGTGHGSIGRVDLRTGKVINKYHGFSGSVKSICCYEDEGCGSVFGACGLDRYVRIYSMDQPSVIYKKYLKLFCNSLLISSLTYSKRSTDGDEGESVPRIAGVKRTIDSEYDSDDDSVWEEMEVVKDNKLPKQKKIDTRIKK